MNESTLVIQAASLEDIPGLAAFSIETFYDTYRAFNTPEDMQEYVNKYFSIPHLTAEMNTAGTHFFVAKEDSNITGYIKLRDQENPDAIRLVRPLELERIYVHPSQKGKGIGKTLLDTACHFASSNSYKSLWLGVWEKNTKAIRFYERYGFSYFGNHEFVLGKDVQNDFLYFLEL